MWKRARWRCTWHFRANRRKKFTSRICWQIMRMKFGKSLARIMDIFTFAGKIFQNIGTKKKKRASEINPDLKPFHSIQLSYFFLLSKFRELNVNFCVLNFLGFFPFLIAFWRFCDFFRDARNMARDVHNFVLKVIIEKGNMTEQQAVAYLKKMEAQKRYSADVWSWAVFITCHHRYMPYFDSYHFWRNICLRSAQYCWLSIWNTSAN